MRSTKHEDTYVYLIRVDPNVNDLNVWNIFYYLRDTPVIIFVAYKYETKIIALSNK